MPVYEKVANGRVVETVHTVDGSHSDTLYGVMALEDRDGWRPLADPEPGLEELPTPPAEAESAPVVKARPKPPREV